MLKYLLAFLLAFSMSCSLYTSAKGGDVHEYMKGSDARERIRNSLTLFPGYFDYALSNIETALAPSVCKLKPRSPI